jgi:hypothetical protein
MPRGPKRYARRNHGADITIDDILLKTLEDGPATVNDIVKRFERRVRIRLDNLRVRGAVIREGRGGLIVSTLTDWYDPTLPRRRSARGAAVSRALQT